MFVGVDGCRKGWLAVLLTGREGWKVEIFQDIARLWNNYSSASLILIDIPIGLCEKSPEERRCDKEARKLLGAGRASSVFSVPCRAAVYARKEHASSINRERTGRGLSLQTRNIIPKIREVDNLLSRDKSAKSRIREIHPEICFWAFAGYSMKYSKKTREGFEERRHVLKSVYPHTDEIIDAVLEKYLRKDVVRDDILDALSAGVTGLLGEKKLNSIPEIPEIDSKGLRMEMVFKRMGKNHD